VGSCGDYCQSSSQGCFGRLYGGCCGDCIWIALVVAVVVVVRVASWIALIVAVVVVVRVGFWIALVVPVLVTVGVSVGFVVETALEINGEFALIGFRGVSARAGFLVQVPCITLSIEVPHIQVLLTFEREKEQVVCRCPGTFTLIRFT
jgi:uncharacterized membrane protein